MQPEETQQCFNCVDRENENYPLSKFRNLSAFPFRQKRVRLITQYLLLNTFQTMVRFLH